MPTHRGISPVKLDPPPPEPHGEVTAPGWQQAQERESEEQCRCKPRAAQTSDARTLLTGKTTPWLRRRSVEGRPTSGAPEALTTQGALQDQATAAPSTRLSGLISSPSRSRANSRLPVVVLVKRIQSTRTVAVSQGPVAPELRRMPTQRTRVLSKSSVVTGKGTALRSRGTVMNVVAIDCRVRGVLNSVR